MNNVSCNLYLLVPYLTYKFLFDFRKQKLSAQLKDYTTEFNVDKFLELIPNPEEYFNDPKRVISYEINGNIRYELDQMFRDLFTYLRVADIATTMKVAERESFTASCLNKKQLKPTILGIYNTLSKIGDKMKRERKRLNNPDVWANHTNIPMMQEVSSSFSHSNRPEPFA